MKDKFEKYLSWGFYAVIAIGSFLGILFFINGSFEMLIQFSYVLMILTAAISLIAPIFSFVQHPKNTKNLFIILGVIGVIALISYLMAGNGYSAIELEKNNITASESVNISFGLIFTFIIMILTVVSVLFSSVYKFFK